MPIYEYECDGCAAVTEIRRSYAGRNAPAACQMCGATTTRIEISKPHVEPSGVYSYLPNLGSARDFERRQNALETGQKVIKRTFDDND